MIDFSEFETHNSVIFLCRSREEAIQCYDELTARFGSLSWSREGWCETVDEVFLSYKLIAPIVQVEDNGVYFGYDTSLGWLMSAKHYCTYPMLEFSSLICESEDLGEIITEEMHICDLFL